VPCTDRADTKVRIALESFREDVGRYPTTAEGLRALRERPAAVPAAADGRRFGWDGPYLEAERDLRDAHGRLLGYRSPAADGRAFEVWVEDAE
jgi:general secretion pathway protein G